VLDEENVPPIDSDEIVARYMLNKRNIREDQTIKPDEFIPYKYVDLSVNRHRDCIESEIWKFGQQVAEQRNKKLLGRTDIGVKDCTVDSLSVVAKPIPGNPNHADITGYPPKKADQKAMALKIAANCSDLKTIT
jgi:hypothetical protein